MEGLIAVGALLLGGTETLNTLQSILIITGLPFSLMLIMIIGSLFYQLYQDDDSRPEENIFKRLLKKLKRKQTTKA